MKIFFSGRIPRDTGGSAAVYRPANAVRGIKYAICLHNRTHKAGGAHRRAFRGRPCSRQPPKSRRDFCTQKTRHAAERIKWSASGATKKSGHVPDFFNKHENTPKTGKFSGCFRAIGVPALPAKRARAATPSLVPKAALRPLVRSESLYGSRRFMSRGNMDASRMLFSPKSCMVSRSSPIPSPP